MKRNKNILLIVVMMMVVASCKFAPNNLNIPNWEADILGPLVNTTANGNNIVQMRSLKGSTSISIKALGDTAVGVYQVPATPKTNLPPVHYNMFNTFQTLTLESGTLNVTLTNNMPVTLKSGTIINVINKVSTTTVLSYQLPVDVPAYNGNYTFSADMAGKTIEDSLILRVDSISTDSSAGPVNITGNESFTISAELINAKFLSCTITNDSLRIRDTSQFNLNGYKVKTQVTGGTITTFVTNGLPFDMNLQFYFMKDDRITIIDSLFDNMSLIHAAISTTQPRLDSVLFTITDNKLNHMTEARYLVSTLQVRDITSSVTITKNDSVRFLLVGNLKVQLN